MKKEIKDKSFVKIPGWVVNRLHLTGDEAIVYSLILGYKDGFQEPISYIAAWTECKERTVQKILRQLEDAGLLLREEKSGKPTSYKCTDPCNRCTPATDAPLQQVHPTPATDTPPTPYYIDNIDNNISTTDDERAPAHTCTREEEATGKEQVMAWITDNEEVLAILLHRVGLIHSAQPVHVLRETIRPYVDAFYEQLLIDGKDDIERRGRQEVKQHFARWLKKRTEAENQQSTNTNNNGNTNRRGNSASGTREGVPYDEFAKQFLIGFNSGKKERGM